MKEACKALYLSHGGGPMPLLGDAGHEEMVSCLERIASTIPKPDALVVVSAHWEERLPTITSGANPALIYDYYGFPEESYEIRYPCPGRALPPPPRGAFAASACVLRRGAGALPGLVRTDHHEQKNEHVPVVNRMLHGHTTSSLNHERWSTMADKIAEAVRA